MNIFPVIVLYKCGLSQSRTYQSLLSNAVDLTFFMVYDNSPKTFAQNTDDLPKNCLYVRDINNNGLSIAYNHAAKKARELGFSYLLLLDQDTLFPADAWKKYNENISFKGVIAPMMNTNIGLPFSPTDVNRLVSKAVRIAPGDYSLYHYNVANSGICVPLDLFEQVEGYDLNVFLDYSDNQFLRRVRKKCDKLRILDITATQDFSGDCKNVSNLVARFDLYLLSARQFKLEGFKDSVGHYLVVFKHAVALFIRTHNAIFISKFFKIFLLFKIFH